MPVRFFPGMDRSLVSILREAVDEQLDRPVACLAGLKPSGPRACLLKGIDWSGCRFDGNAKLLCAGLLRPAAVAEPKAQIWSQRWLEAHGEAQVEPDALECAPGWLGGSKRAGE